MSPYSSLNNTGVYDNFGAGGNKATALVGVGYDNVSQVDKWLHNVEYNLDQTEQAVQRANLPVTTSNMSSLSLRRKENPSEGAAYNAGQYSAAVRSNDIENINGKASTYIGNTFGSQQKNKNAILRSQSSNGSLQRSQSLGRGQLASSLANLKARLGSRGSSRERMQQRFGSSAVLATNANGYSSSLPSGQNLRTRLTTSRERTTTSGYRNEQRRTVLKRTVSEPVVSHQSHGHSCGQGHHHGSYGHHAAGPNAASTHRSKSPQKVQLYPAPAASHSKYDFSNVSEVDTFSSGASEESTAVLSRCPTCDRTFNPKALEKHMKICQKVFKSKRPKFSSQDARMSGMEKVDDGLGSSSSGGGSYGRYNSRKKKVQGSRGGKFGQDRPVGGSKPKWKVQSEQFRAAMMAARGVNDGSSSYGGFGGSSSSSTPVDDGLIPCPHCGRTFNETAAERHIERCKDMKHRPKTLKAGGGRGAYQMRSSSRTNSYSRSSSSSSMYRF
ncbi:hypothetical protein HOP50_19g84360 [Chloropicon primus]|nr:hypothetical protein HOP50_19g84360 [Chloropicon primus]